MPLLRANPQAFLASKDCNTCCKKASSEAEIETGVRDSINGILVAVAKGLAIRGGSSQAVEGPDLIAALSRHGPFISYIRNA